MTLTRLAAGIAAALFAAGLANASGPEKPECVAPANPGGGFDLTCRVAQAGLASQLSGPMEVSFMPGGIGAVAINLFNTTRTDDPNAIVAFSSGSLLNIAVGKYGQWTEKDVRWLASAGADFGAVIVRADSKFTSLKDLMDSLAADESSVVVGSGGSVGSQDWMKAALLVRSVGKDPRKLRFVAFDGGGESIAALLGGAIEVYMGDVGEMKGRIADGTMRVLAVMSNERLGAPFEAIPTAKEQGYDVEWTIMRGYYMGKNVSDEAYNAYVEMFQKAFAMPEYAAIQAEKGLLPLNMAGEEFSADVLRRVENMRVIAREAGLIQ